MAIIQFIYLGMSWRYLQDAIVGSPIHDKGYILWNIKDVLDALARYKLLVTLRAASELRALQQELAKSPAGTMLDTGQAMKLRQIMIDLRRTLDAEAISSLAYIVTDKRLDVRKLVGDTTGLFAPGVFDLLPDVAKYDFREAGYCVAVERPTAAAFHLLRGTEDVLRSFYCRIVKRNRVHPLLWGPMTDSLRKRRKPPPSELIGNLDNIRISFRNPTQHPEKIYDIQEAQDLFSLCVDVVNRMVRNQAWKNFT